MTSEERLLLRQTFEKIVPLSKRFGREFYARLFELDPELRRLFRGDLDQQASMLSEALVLAVLQLIDEGKVSNSVRQLGLRHAHYGIVDQHYQTFGAALLWMLEQRFGDEFTPQLRSVWQEAWDLLAEAMQDAARSAAVAR